MADTNDVYLVYVTAPGPAEAKRLAAAAVEARLAACANVLPAMNAFFWWEGQVQDESEIPLILKTSKACLEGLTELLKTQHSYDCPCVVAWPIETGNADFLRWISSETRPPPA